MSLREMPTANSTIMMEWAELKPMDRKECTTCGPTSRLSLASSEWELSFEESSRLRNCTIENIRRRCSLILVHCKLLKKESRKKLATKFSRMFACC